MFSRWGDLRGSAGYADKQPSQGPEHKAGVVETRAVVIKLKNS